MLDKAADQAATQAAALVINQIRSALKAALKELFKEYIREFAEYVFHEKWIRVVMGLLTLMGLVGYWIKEHS